MPCRPDPLLTDHRRINLAEFDLVARPSKGNAATVPNEGGQNPVGRQWDKKLAHKTRACIETLCERLARGPDIRGLV